MLPSLPGFVGFSNVGRSRMSPRNWRGFVFLNWRYKKQSVLYNCIICGYSHRICIALNFTFKLLWFYFPGTFLVLIVLNCKNVETAIIWRPFELHKWCGNPFIFLTVSLELNIKFRVFQRLLWTWNWMALVPLHPWWCLHISSLLFSWAPLTVETWGGGSVHSVFVYSCKSVAVTNGTSGKR